MARAIPGDSMRGLGADGGVVPVAEAAAQVVADDATIGQEEAGLRLAVDGRGAEAGDIALLAGERPTEADANAVVIAPDLAETEGRTHATCRRGIEYGVIRQAAIGAGGVDGVGVVVVEGDDVTGVGFPDHETAFVGLEAGLCGGHQRAGGGGRYVSGRRYGCDGREAGAEIPCAVGVVVDDAAIGQAELVGGAVGREDAHKVALFGGSGPAELCAHLREAAPDFAKGVHGTDGGGGRCFGDGVIRQRADGGGGKDDDIADGVGAVGVGIDGDFARTGFPCHEAALIGLIGGSEVAGINGRAGGRRVGDGCGRDVESLSGVDAVGVGEAVGGHQDGIGCAVAIGDAREGVAALDGDGGPVGARDAGLGRNGWQAACAEQQW